MNSIIRRKFQILIGFAIFSFAVMVSYFSVDEIDISETPQYDIFLVIDVSESMNSEEKIIFAKQAALEFVDEFHLEQSSKHRIGLISFSDTGNMIVQLETNPESLKNGIKNLYPDGATAMGDGISIAIQSLSQQPRFDTQKVIVLLSDGMSNTGANPLIVAGVAFESGVKIFSVGYGFYADTQTLKAVASLTNGKYFNASSGEDLADTFNEIAEILISPISHYSSRILILIAIPLLLFIPTIERSLTTMIRRSETIPSQETDTQDRMKTSTLQQQITDNCPNCHFYLKPNSKFCGKCGTRRKGRVNYA